MPCLLAAGRRRAVRGAHPDRPLAHHQPGCVSACAAAWAVPGQPMTACCGRCLDGSELSQPQSCALLPTDALLTHSGLPASPPLPLLQRPAGCRTTAWTSTRPMPTSGERVSEPAWAAGSRAGCWPRHLGAPLARIAGASSDASAAAQQQPHRQGSSCAPGDDARACAKGAVGAATVPMCGWRPVWAAAPSAIIASFITSVPQSSPQSSFSPGPQRLQGACGRMRRRMRRGVCRGTGLARHLWAAAPVIRQSGRRSAATRTPQQLPHAPEIAGVRGGSDPVASAAGGGTGLTASALCGPAARACPQCRAPQHDAAPSLLRCRAASRRACSARTARGAANPVRDGRLCVAHEGGVACLRR